MRSERVKMKVQYDNHFEINSTIYPFTFFILPGLRFNSITIYQFHNNTMFISKIPMKLGYVRGQKKLRARTNEVVQLNFFLILLLTFLIKEKS